MAVDFEQDGSVATITLNRPEALNAFNSEQLKALLKTLRKIASDDSIRCVILTGEGSRAFAAGADIKEMVDLSEEEGMAFGRLGHAVTGAIAQLPQPVIAAVNGYALGGGCEVAVAADIRFASENAVFAQPEVTLGIPPGWGGSQRLPRLIGPGLAAEMIFSGRRVTAEEALRIGLVNAVYPADDLMQQASKLAMQIAANSPRSVRNTKLLMSLAFNGQPWSGLETEAQLFGESFATADQREGMTAFLEKRKAAFTGS